MNRVIVSIYIDPDFYPPTINAILNLAEKFKEVIVISRNNSRINYPFPGNVYLKKVGPFISVRDTETKGMMFKVFSFVQFSKAILKHAREKKTDLLVFYDPIPLLSFLVIRTFLSRGIKVWYHNHDMPDINLTKKFSIGWFSAKYEQKAMKYIDFFSLPSSDRLEFYPNLDKKKLQYFTIPNYPSLKVYRSNSSKAPVIQKLTVIFQGFIGEGLALEQMIELLCEKMNGLELQLILKGPVYEEYKEKLNSLATQFGVSDKLKWVAIGPYADLPALTSGCDIGLALYIKTDNVSKTLGTASNKIYEYAASGLPVILYNIEQFEKYLKKYSWTFFSDGSKGSLKDTIIKILENLPELSKAARNDFENELNFERHFSKAMNVISESFSHPIGQR